MAIAGLFFLLFLAARIALFLLYPEDFQTLKRSEVLNAFVRGLRFDASIIFCTIGGPLFLMMWPFRWAQSRWWLGLWGWLCFVSFLFFVFLISVDLIYYDSVQRHFGPEVALITDDFDKTVDEAFGQHLWAMLVFLAGTVGLFFLWRRLLRPGQERKTHLLPRIAVAIIAGSLMFVAARGGLDKERILIAHAYDGVPPEGANLVLSGPFTALHFLVKVGFMDVNFHPWEEALATTQQLLVSPGEKIEDPEYPLLRHRSAPRRRKEKPNVVIIMLEGWSARSVDVIRDETGLPPLGATGNFDALSREGVLLSRFYATGQRTRYGLSSILTGLPFLPNLPPLGKGLEQNRLPFLGHIATREGYETIYLHAGNVDDRRRDTSTAATGFHHLLGKGNIAKNTEKLWDFELLKEANRHFSEAKKPFLGFIHTPSPHTPYDCPKGPWNQFPPDSREHRYLNALGYSDWALGQYFLLAKEERYFKNTIFIILSDHTQRRLEGPSEPPDLFHIPGLVIAPGLQPAVYEEIGSQVDVIPTLIDLAGWESSHASFGRSLFDNTPGTKRGAMCTLLNTIIRVEKDGWVHHSLKRRVNEGTYREGADLNAIENRLLSVIQVAVTLYVRNRLCPPGFSQKSHP